MLPGRGLLIGFASDQILGLPRFLLIFYGWNPIVRLQEESYPVVPLCFNYLSICLSK